MDIGTDNKVKYDVQGKKRIVRSHESHDGVDVQFC